MVGFHSVTHSEFLATGLRLFGSRKEEKKMIEKAHDIMRFLEFDFIDYGEIATNLPYGYRRLVEIGRALAADPKVLLLDEPAAGLNDQETKELGKTLNKIRTLNISIILVEHNMDLLMDVSERVVVINYGEKIAEGTPSQVQKDPKVIEAYLVNMAEILELQNVSSYYGQLCALNDISIKVEKGKIVTMIGANGAGKCTLLKTICCLLEAKKGRIIFNGKDITNKKTETLAGLGLSLIPEGREIFTDLTVQENILLGAACHLRKASKQEIEDRFQSVYDIFPRLMERKNQWGGPFRAANNRCWLSEGDSCQSHLCSSMSLQWD